MYLLTSIKLENNREQLGVDGKMLTKHGSIDTDKDERKKMQMNILKFSSTSCTKHTIKEATSVATKKQGTQRIDPTWVQVRPQVHRTSTTSAPIKARRRSSTVRHAPWYGSDVT